VPILAAGSGAPEFAAVVEPFGMRVTAVDAPAGAATTVKLLRSVYMKGRDALVAEMMLAARRRGVDRLVAESIKGPGEEVPFPDLADRILASLAIHAGRRADELEASGELVEAADVDPAATSGAVCRLRALAELDLATRGSAERLTSEQVLDLLDRLAAR
jgi:3-hydroxyisobutyrate dehydrogenase-like beta-hydroxyacid dehydrogenase